MLQKLCIKNIALIENAEISFTDGLNVLSGLIPAGKAAKQDPVVALRTE